MTASTGTRTLTDGDFKVADLSLAGFGRKEIQLAEHEMPGLMALRAEYGDQQPLAGALGTTTARQLVGLYRRAATTLGGPGLS